MDVLFSMEGMLFQYDDNKNRVNIKKHGISFEMAARIFLDYDRIEMYDEENSLDEDRYNTIGNIIAPNDFLFENNTDIIFVVYTERVAKDDQTIIRLISARRATHFEKGVYYGNY